MRAPAERDTPRCWDRLVAGCGLPRVEARALLEHASGRPREWLIAHGDEPAPGPVAAAFDALAMRRREVGEPIAYLTGRREFHGRDFEVGPGVLIPRPETEVLVDAALARGPEALADTTLGRGPETLADAAHAREPGSGARAPLPRASLRVLDLGTGSGNIAISLACLRPGWSVLATDRSADALAIARRNAQRLCPEAIASARLAFATGDWWGAVPDGERFALIVSNPPYVAAGDEHLGAGDLRFEPACALASGGDGLDALRAIAAGAPARLAGGGWLIVEHGFDQGAAVRTLFTAAGLADVATLADDAGLDRVTLGLRR